MPIIKQKNRFERKLTRSIPQWYIDTCLRSQFTNQESVNRFEAFYESASGQIFELPKAITLENDASPLLRLFSARNSHRSYSGSTLQLSELLFFHRSIFRTRSYPSAGGLYKVTPYYIVNRVDGLEPGVYHLPNHHESAPSRLYALTEHDKSVDKTYSFDNLSDAAFILFLTAEHSAITEKYGDRGWRYAFLEAGHIGQNVSLLATERGWKHCCIGGGMEDTLCQWLGTTIQHQAPLYSVAVGL
ncbi:nitroreductase [Vibrio coralliilyticus]|nr:SagB/ThcOx family dehydrogenase [Vibrio coralliilyticus]KPH27166.1 nitroreductase [Vibrio coralliilyticus]